MTAAELAEQLRADPALTLEALALTKLAGRRCFTPFAISARLGVSQEWDRAVAAVYRGKDKQGALIYVGEGPVPPLASGERITDIHRRRERFEGPDLDEVCDRTDAAWTAAGWVFPPPTEEEIASRKIMGKIKALLNGIAEDRERVVAEMKAKLTGEDTREQLLLRAYIAILEAPRA